METMTVREKLYDYIRYAEEKKVKALYTLIEGEMESKADHWEDPGFIEKLEKRASEYENGEITARSWKEIKAR